MKKECAAQDLEPVAPFDLARQPIKKLLPTKSRAKLLKRPHVNFVFHATTQTLLAACDQFELYKDYDVASKLAKLGKQKAKKENDDKPKQYFSAYLSGLKVYAKHCLPSRLESAIEAEIDKCD